MRATLHIAPLLVLLASSPAGAGSPREPAPAPAPTVARPPPFGAGTMNVGLSLGMSSGEGTAFNVGAGFGYFVLPGLQPGVLVDVTFGSDTPTITALQGYLQWVVWRSWTVSPFVKLQGGHQFVSGDEYEDISQLGGGGGFLFFLARYAALQAEFLVFRLLPDRVCGDSCVAYTGGLSVRFFFGGGGEPRRPAPPRSPAAAPGHEAQEPIPQF